MSSSSSSSDGGDGNAGDNLPPHVRSAIDDLINSNDGKTLDDAMTLLFDELQTDEGAICNRLKDIILGYENADVRAIALETLAHARVSSLEPVVCQIISELLQDSDEQMRTSAIASSSHLSLEYRKQLIVDISEISLKEKGRAASAARAFLRYNQNK